MKKRTMDKWIKCIKNMTANSTPGECPCCKSKNTDFRYTAVMNDGYGYCDIWCNDCKHAFHISRIKVPADAENKTVPDNLIY